MIALSLLLVLLASGASPQGQELAPDDCKPIRQVEALPDTVRAEFRDFLDFTRACPVHSPEGEAKLSIISVWVLDYEDKLLSDGQYLQPPLPVVVVPKGDVVGRLPLPFPEDGPSRTRIWFGHWQDGWPNRISIRTESASVDGTRNHRGLVWDRVAKIFVQEK